MEDNMVQTIVLKLNNGESINCITKAFVDEENINDIRVKEILITKPRKLKDGYTLGTSDCLYAD